MSNFPGKRRYEGVRFNVINVTRGWVEDQFPGKKHYITLERPLTRCETFSGHNKIVDIFIMFNDNVGR